MPQPLSEFQSLGGYVVLGLPEHGGMSDVYPAWHPELDQKAALKVPRLDTALGMDFEFFRNEARTLAALDHPNITRFYAAGVDDGRPYIAMEFIADGTLADAKHHARYTTPLGALNLLRTIAGAVAHAHARNVLHCDIKPPNILFDDDGIPHVTDFGLARPGDGPNEGRTWLRGGTFGWMAPEQMAEPAVAPASIQQIKETADVFGLGVLLFWLVHGQLPFGAEADYATRATRDPRPSPGKWSPSRLWAVRAICAKALSVEPAQRFHSVAELDAELQRALNHERY